MGRLLAPSPVCSMGWQWFEEATALPRAAQRPRLWSKAEQPRRHTAADVHNCQCQSRPPPTLFLASREKLRPCRTLFSGPWSSSIKKDVFVTENGSVSLNVTSHTERNVVQSTDEATRRQLSSKSTSIRIAIHELQHVQETSVSRAQEGVHEEGPACRTVLPPLFRRHVLE